MKLVVADTGALISLSVVGKLGLITQVFDQLIIAEAVWEELNKYENQLLSAADLKLLEKYVSKI